MDSKIINFGNIQKEMPEKESPEETEKEVDKVHITYADGTVEEMTKGAIIKITDDNKYIGMAMTLLEMEDKDMICMVHGFAQFVMESGVLDFITRKR